MAQGACPWGPELHRAEAPHARPIAPYGVRGGALPQHRGVLGAPRGHVHDPGRRLHSKLHLLRGRPPAPPPPPPRGEPVRLATAVERMGLRHVVITSVDRDDLPNGGAEMFA